MLPAKKRLWIEILLHLLFWTGVFYVLTSLNSSHIHRLLRAPRADITRDLNEKTSILAFVYIILVYLAALFYGNIFLVFPRVIRYKKGILRLAICAGWFTMVFSANYVVVGPLFEKANPIPEQPRGFIPFRRDTVLQLPVMKPDNPFRP